MVKSKFCTTVILMLATVATLLTGCSELSQLTGGLIPGNSEPLTGEWTMGFQNNDQVTKANLRLKQKGEKFVGVGQEDNGRKFKLFNGIVKDGQLTFNKSYLDQNPSEANLVVTYSGAMQMLNDPDYKGPYLTGQYSATSQSGTLTGEWEAQLVNAPKGDAKPAAQAPGPAANNPPAEADGTISDTKAPDLSGKWQIAFRHNFKIIKSTMFIEQEGGKLAGRGVDTNTNERFVIEKGWYNYPKVTFVRKYTKGKDAASTRSWTFKGEVSVVHDADYQGPYMKGEFQGGGDWEGQQVK